MVWVILLIRHGDRHKSRNRLDRSNLNEATTAEADSGVPGQGREQEQPRQRQTQEYREHQTEHRRGGTLPGPRSQTEVETERRTSSSPEQEPGSEQRKEHSPDHPISDTTGLTESGVGTEAGTVADKREEHSRAIWPG